MAGPIDFSSNALVRDINSAITSKYKKYIPPDKLEARPRVLYYMDAGEYQKALQRASQAVVDRRLADFKQNQPDVFARAQKLHGNTLAGQLRALDIYRNHDRYQKAAFTSSGFYDPHSNTISLRKTDPATIAHELLHLYSYSRDKTGPYSYFESIFKPEIAEGMIEMLALELGKAIARSHGLTDALKLYESAEMPRVLIGKDYLERNAISISSVLHLLFEGWFRHDEKRGFVPSDKRTRSQDLKRFSAKELQDWSNAYRWLVTPRGPAKTPGLKAPGSIIPRSADLTSGLTSLRPSPWPLPMGRTPGPFSPGPFVAGVSSFQHLQDELMRRHRAEEARRRSLEATRPPSTGWSGAQQAERRRIEDRERRRLEEEAARRTAQQRRAQELEQQRAREEMARRAAEDARRRAALDAVRNRRVAVPRVDPWKFIPPRGPRPEPWPWVTKLEGGRFVKWWQPTADEILCRRKIFGPGTWPGSSVFKPGGR